MIAMSDKFSSVKHASKTNSDFLKQNDFYPMLDVSKQNAADIHLALHQIMCRNIESQLPGQLWKHDEKNRREVEE